MCDRTTKLKQVRRSRDNPESRASQSVSQSDRYGDKQQQQPEVWRFGGRAIECDAANLLRK